MRRTYKGYRLIKAPGPEGYDIYRPDGTCMGRAPAREEAVRMIDREIWTNEEGGR